MDGAIHAEYSRAELSCCISFITHNALQQGCARHPVMKGGDKSNIREKLPLKQQVYLVSLHEDTACQKIKT